PPGGAAGGTRRKDRLLEFKAAAPPPQGGIFLERSPVIVCRKKDQRGSLRSGVPLRRHKGPLVFGKRSPLNHDPAKWPTTPALQQGPVRRTEQRCRLLPLDTLSGGGVHFLTAPPSQL